jgi:hypothetical protein
VLAIVDERIAISDEDNHRWIISWWDYPMVFKTN